MTEEMNIRLVQRGDLPQVLELYKLLNGPYGEDESANVPNADMIWRALEADHRQQVLIAEAGGRIIATLTLIIIPNLGHGNKPWAAIENVVVSGEYRGQGVGARMMEEAGGMARAAGCYKLVLSSNLTRLEAHEFYRRLGWRETHIGFSLEL